MAASHRKSLLSALHLSDTDEMNLMKPKDVKKRKEKKRKDN